MKYRILLEADMESVADTGEALEYLSKCLEGSDIRLLEVRCASERTGIVRRSSAPGKKEVLEYFKAANLPFDDDPTEEAARFYAYNEQARWRRGFEWRRLADLWIKRLNNGGGRSFDADEFFHAALEKSNREAET